MPNIKRLKDAHREWREQHAEQLQDEKYISENSKHKHSFYNNNIWRTERSYHIQHYPVDEVLNISGTVVLAEHCHHLIKFDNQLTDDIKLMLLGDDDNIVSVSTHTHKLIHNMPDMLPVECQKYIRDRRNKVYNKYKEKNIKLVCDLNSLTD